LLSQFGSRSTAADRRERRRLKRMMRITARARDAQVQVRLLNRLTGGSRPRDLEKFRQLLDRRACRFGRKLRHALAARPRRLRPGRHAPPSPATATSVHPALRRAFARLRLRLGSARSSGKRKALHRARLAAKDCRYLAEAAGVTQTQLARLRTLQVALGELHDLDLLLARIEDHATRHRRTEAWLKRNGTTVRQRRMRLWRSLPPTPRRTPPEAAAGRQKGVR
jgi:CHAD domain-containing protein